MPKRSDQRRRRNKVDIDSAPVAVASGVVRGPECPEDFGGLAKQWYESLRTSGQSEFYADSDWTSALIIARAIERFEERPSAHMLTAILSGFGSLAATEGDRRRLRIELERDVASDEDEDAAVLAIDEYQRRVSG
ncbi:hypothetical protein [Nonomuraea basaltis]|uniref:phage terminase small subunit n=1 Tax=Nonomuraea basaltis TaxID=2495887 RepID=UPI00110C437F|nr:hypothetical protein [Nonomuraea basaltis]TMS00178.1 hypothetical protein EJK15_03645 [Nonomuraea basaltis]